MSDLANSTGISVTTIREWLNMLESSFITFRLPPCFENFGRRLIKSPKIYFSEPGLAAYLLGIREPAHVGYGPFLGALFENMVVVEALKTIYNRAEDANIYFYRDNNGLKADMLIDFYRYPYPVEIKASQTFSPDFAKSIFRLHKVAPKIQSGAVVYAGNLETAYKGIHLTHFSHTQVLFS